VLLTLYYRNIIDLISKFPKAKQRKAAAFKESDDLANDLFSGKRINPIKIDFQLIEVVYLLAIKYSLTSLERQTLESVRNAPVCILRWDENRPALHIPSLLVNSDSSSLSDYPSYTMHSAFRFN
jgi:hypothetical protein